MVKLCLSFLQEILSTVVSPHTVCSNTIFLFTCNILNVYKYIDILPIFYIQATCLQDVFCHKISLTAKTSFLRLSIYSIQAGHFLLPDFFHVNIIGPGHDHGYIHNLVLIITDSTKCYVLKDIYARIQQQSIVIVQIPDHSKENILDPLSCNIKTQKKNCATRSLRYAHRGDPYCLKLLVKCPQGAIRQQVTQQRTTIFFLISST